VQIEDASSSLHYIIINECANASVRVVVHRLLAGGAIPAGPRGAGDAVAFDEDAYSLSGGGLPGGCSVLG
jgi:hypothetical protein